MEGTFGSRLRSQREQQQIPMSVIAERTKIKASLLEALERDDVSQWPTGIFRRSFVRAYAQAIGLDADVVLREFLELYPEPVEEDVAAALVAARENRRPPTRLGYLISTAIGALPMRVPAAWSRSAPQAEAAGVLHPDAAAGGVESGALQSLATDPPQDEPFFSLDDPPAQGGCEAALVRDTVPLAAGGDDAVRDHRPADALRVDAGPVLEHQAFDSRSGGLADAASESPGSIASHPGMTTITAPAWSEVADLCSRLARALQPRDVIPVLEDAVRVLDAVGLIVWLWDPPTRTLGHVLAHGYSCDMLARLPRVRWETDNAIAEAFRAADTRVVRGSGTATGAVAVPIVTAVGCAGVLAIELQDRGEEREWVRAVAAILAAQMAGLFGFQTLVEAVGA